MNNKVLFAGLVLFLLSFGSFAWSEPIKLPASCFEVYPLNGPVRVGMAWCIWNSPHYFATDAHVVLEGPNDEVVAEEFELKNGRTRVIVEVAAYDTTHDTAILRTVDEHDESIPRLALGPLHQDLTGIPIVLPVRVDWSRFESQTGHAIEERWWRPRRDRPHWPTLLGWITTCRARAGTSGAPILDTDGYVIGMLVAADSERNTQLSNGSFFVPIRHTKYLLDRVLKGQ